MLKAKYFVLSLSLLCVGCIKRYKFTTKVCDDNLYVEFYETNLAGGVDAEYLTDSINFRSYVGTINEGEQRYKYNCIGDSVFIQKFESRDSVISDTSEFSVEKKAMSLGVLRRQHRYE